MPGALLRFTFHPCYRYSKPSGFFIVRVLVIKRYDPVMPRFSRYALCVGVFVVVLAGCDSSREEDATPPALLPADAFSLQTNLFQQEGSAKTSAGPNFTAAALRVWPVSVILSANLIIPVAVTVAALQVEPEQDGRTWIWTSTTRVNGQEATFTLTGTPQGTTIRWSMRVSLSGGLQPLDDFELYTAQTDLVSQAGSWQLFYPIDGERRNVLNADFGVSGDLEATITYSVPPSADQHAGDAVYYEVEGEARVFFWTQVAEGQTHLVGWDADTRVGSITATDYNDGQEACWDENLDDAACSN